MDDAIAREMAIKEWRREWIEAMNPTCRDLHPDLL
jgi:predicted GIY-YIG superfamily endonuclease